MVNPQLLQILVCPETKQPVHPADADLLGKVNAAVEADQLRNRAGRSIQSPFEAGLVREDGRVLYPVVDDIPVMLIDESISLDSLA
jgi:uncharacterized protein